MKFWWLIVFFFGCATRCAPISWGYLTTNDVSYQVSALQRTPSGIRYDASGQDFSGALLDRLTAEVEGCLGKPIDRSSFVVKVPADWSLSCDKSQQVLPSGAPGEGCDAKGLKNACPCRWRALIQCPNVIVTTPSLYLYKDALTRWAAHVNEPYSRPELAKCARPTTEPL